MITSSPRDINFSASFPAEPIHMHHLSRAFGLLASIQPVEDCQLAQIGQRLVVLPQDLDLSGHIGQRIGLIRVDEKYLIRRLA
jgi:hypothetical protein